MRNLTKRTIFGLLFIAILIGGLFVGKIGFALLGAFAITTMMEEFFHMTMGEKYISCRIAAIACGLVLFALVFACIGFGLNPRFLAAGMIPVLAMMVLSVLSKDRSDINLLSNLFTGLIYIAGPISLSSYLVFGSDGYSPMLILGFFVIIWSTDIGAYCIGTLFGQKTDSRKLCPAISPKKSWIGFLGGLFFGVVAASLLSGSSLLPYSMPHCLAIGLIIHVFGVFGDLFESQWKRRYGLKDSGNIIPGHGGMLDRFDSSLFAMPAAACYLELVGLI